MAEFDVDAMLARFRSRAAAVRERGVPPIEGTARKQYIKAAEEDFTDFSLLGNASWEVADGELVLRIPLSSQD